MHKIGIVDKIHQDGINLLKNNPKFECELIEDVSKKNLISNGDDYQILFTASGVKSRIIDRTSKILGIKITKIGKIIRGTKKSYIIDKKDKKIVLKNKGYTHQF